MRTTDEEHSADMANYDPSLYDHPCLQPNQVEDRLYLSSAYTEAAPVEVLQRHGITHILQVGYELQPHHPGMFAYNSVQIADRFDQDIVQCLPGAFQFISQGMQDGKVLVHCAHGQSRSASVIIAYLMWRDGKPYAECLAAVKACRPRVKPNDGFEMQLRLLQDLGFDRWPGWSAETFIAVRQHELVQQGLADAKQTATASTLQQQQPQQQQQQQQALWCQSPQQQQQLLLHAQQPLQLQQQPAYQQDIEQQSVQQSVLQSVQEAAGPACTGELEHQDLVVLTSTLQLPEACGNCSCGCSKKCACEEIVDPLAAGTSSSRKTLQVDVNLGAQQTRQQQQQQQQRRRLQPVCCAVM